MRDLLYLAWRHMLHYRGRSTVLVLSLALLAFVPIGLRLLVERSGEALRARAAENLLLVGEKGSSVDLVMRLLYFEGQVPQAIPFREVARIDESGHALALPMHVRFSARGFPIVGTDLEYLRHRGLRPAQGRRFARMGECVLGAAMASELGLGPGDRIVSSPENAFDLAGSYPLEMDIVGVLAPTGGPDDRALFSDLRTTWILEGLGHGHEDLSRPGAEGQVLEREGDRITGNASVKKFRRVDPERADRFHFHGDRAGFPITGILALPRDERARTLLMGRYQAPDERRQILRPSFVLEDLLATLLTIQDYVVLALMLVGISTLLTALLVYMLSLRLREAELRTLERIGASRGRVRAMLAMELGFVLLGAALFAALLLMLTLGMGEAWLRGLLIG